MNYIALLISGWMIGLIAAVPIGPVNLICIRRTLQCGTLYGFISGLGAALGDGLFACIAGFGLTAVAQLIQGYSTILQIVGGIMLMAFGLRMYYAPTPTRMDDSYGPFPEGATQYCSGNSPANSAVNAVTSGNGTANAIASGIANGIKNSLKNGQGSHTRGMASTFALTITNPATFVWFAGWSSGLNGLADNPSFFAAAFAVMGVLLGSTTWWLILTTVVGKLHRRIDDGIVRLLNRIFGVIVFLSGVLLLGHVAVNRLFG